MNIDDNLHESERYRTRKRNSVLAVRSRGVSSSSAPVAIAGLDNFRIEARKLLSSSPIQLEEFELLLSRVITRKIDVPSAISHARSLLRGDEVLIRQFSNVALDHETEKFEASEDLETSSTSTASKNGIGSTAAHNQEIAKHFQKSNVLLENVSFERRRKHKSLLLKLFSGYSESKLRQLRDDTGSALLACDHECVRSKRKKRKMHATRSKVIQRLYRDVNSNDDPRAPRKRRRNENYVSKSLRDVEEQTRICYLSNNPTFSMTFSECSLKATSRWGFRNDYLPMSGQMYQSGPLCHRCLLCQNWGHYEADCESAGGEEMVDRGQFNVRYNQEEMLNSFKVSRSSQQEKCEGISIEQRLTAPVAAVPEYVGSDDEEFQLVETVEVAGSRITSLNYK